MFNLSSKDSPSNCNNMAFLFHFWNKSIFVKQIQFLYTLVDVLFNFQQRLVRGDSSNTYVHAPDISVKEICLFLGLI